MEKIVAHASTLYTLKRKLLVQSRNTSRQAAAIGKLPTASPSNNNPISATTTTTNNNNNNNKQTNKGLWRQFPTSHNVLNKKRWPDDTYLEVFCDGLPAIVVPADGVGRSQHGAPGRKRGHHAFTHFDFIQRQGETQARAGEGCARYQGQGKTQAGRDAGRLKTNDVRFKTNDVRSKTKDTTTR